MIETRLNTHIDTRLETVHLGSKLSYFLDKYGGSVAAFSLRRLSVSYEGNAIRVRRSSDNTEQDIGFSGENLDTASLLSFVGAGDGFIRKLYNQNGAYAAAEQTDVNLQPKIVSNGEVILNNDSPAMDFATNKYLTTNIQQTWSEMSVFAVYSAGANDAMLLSDYLNPDRFFVLGARNGKYLWRVRDNNLVMLTANGPTITADQIIQSSYFNAEIGYAKSSFNGSDLVVASNENIIAFSNQSNFWIGRSPEAAFPFNLNGKVQELIMYDSDLSENNTQINAEIDGYYTFITFPATI